MQGLSSERDVSSNVGTIMDNSLVVTFEQVCNTGKRQHIGVEMSTTGVNGVYDGVERRD